MDVSSNTMAKKVYEFESKFLRWITQKEAAPKASKHPFCADSLFESDFPAIEERSCSLPLHSPQLEGSTLLAILVTKETSRKWSDRLDTLSQDGAASQLKTSPVKDLHSIKKMLDLDCPTAVSLDLDDFKSLKKQTTPSKFSKSSNQVQPILKDRTEEEERKIIQDCLADMRESDSRKVRFSNNHLIVIYKQTQA